MGKGNFIFGQKLIRRKVEEYDILPVEEAKTIIYNSAIDLTMRCVWVFFDEGIVKDISV